MFCSSWERVIFLARHVCSAFFHTLFLHFALHLLKYYYAFNIKYLVHMHVI